MTNASSIARALRGQKSGQDWIAHCPAHDDKHPSLSIGDNNGKVLVYCHAGCSQSIVIEALRRQGLWGNQRQRFQDQGKTQPTLTAEEKKVFALKIWDESVSAAGTLVETYLASRGLTIPIPPSLRFHPELKHLPSGKTYPCMIASIKHGVTGAPIAIQRTYLARDGKGKAPVVSNKMMLGLSRGGAIRLGEPDDFLMVGEGIETCLSALAATCLPAWAGMSASGMAALELPSRIKGVIVLADGDERGESVANQCARRWTRQGKKVRIARPPKGKDFNDLLIDNLSANQRSR